MKKLFISLLGLVVLIVGALLALVLLVNPNQFKPLIVEQAKKQTGLDLVIEGDIGWQFFPSIGFELGKTELKNPQGFASPNLFKVESVGIDVSVMPLLDKQLKIGNIRLDGAEFHLETLKDGRSNLDALAQAQSKPASAPATTDSAPASQPSSSEPTATWSIELGGVSVSNAVLEITDKKAGSHTKLYDVQLSVAEFVPDSWTKATFAAKGDKDQQKFAAQGEAEVRLSADFKQYALRNINLDASFSDPSNQIDSAKLKLDTFEFDKANALTFSVAGKAAEMKLNAQGSASLMVNQAISKVGLDALKLQAELEGAALPQSPMKLSLDSQIAFDLTQNHLSVLLNKLTANALSFDGKADVTLADIPKVRFNLHSPEIDLDAFLGTKAQESQPAPAKEAAASSSSAPATNAPAEVEPDLSALKALDVAGEISIDKFKASNAHLQNVKANFAVNRGVVDLKSFTANLYQGSVQASAQVDARKTPATYSVKKQIKGVQVKPLLKDVLNNEMLEGTGNIDVNVQGQSLTPSGIQKNLVGTVAINFADGAVKGINVAHLIRTHYAKIKGQNVEEADAVKKTDFSAMTTTLKLNKGEVTTNDLNMQSPLLRIHGEGKANYLQQNVDFLVRTSIVGTLEGQGGKSLDELRDVTIPINISGAWSDPKFRLVFDDVLKQKAKKEVDRGVEKLTDKIKDEDTKKAVDGLLKGLFN
ncbi:AsmA family protein [Vibrio cholerae]|uniref:AsmA family protein n=1 Tax=Vibrio cholerae TaxID=666 RepID=A0ABD7SII0_VIBCL|nr:AsmA family protein [Vibrio cholerae]EGR3921635.1 AsmA family protein [Vibrio cholerae]MDV2382450.1 AsmA family protein [Vibrio cholerae]NOF43312.1 AsmA family protein [Vibrio cholerae]TQQ59073.1 AsmA family protein [Vibrio cholerae]TXX64457.1 AsmA family protein [Vibrio cholerae]